MPAEAVIVETFLTGWREFTAAAQAEAASLTELGAAAGFAAKGFTAAKEKAFLAHQGLFTLRRLTYGVTLGLLAAGAAAIHMGFQYTSALQQARVALAPAIKDQRALNAELEHLYYIAAITPFQYKDITQAFRIMYGAFKPLGIGVTETNRTISSMTNALAYAGRSTPGALNRMAVALQHLGYMGRLTGNVVVQLARDGLPIWDILRKQFHLTADQLHAIGRQGISARETLIAINRYMATNPIYMNAAFNQATKTMAGAWATFKDLLSQAMGTSEGGLFSGIQHLLQGVDKALLPFTKKNKAISITDFFKALDQALSPRMHTIFFTFELLKGIVEGIIVSFKTFAGAIYIVLWPLGLLFGHLRSGGIVLRLFGIGMGIIIALAVSYRAGMIAAALATDAYKASQKAAIVVQKLYNIAMAAGKFALDAIRFSYQLLTGQVTLNSLWTAANTTTQEVATAVTWERDAATGALILTQGEQALATEVQAAANAGLIVVTGGAIAATEAQTAATMELNAALYANPIVWVIGLIILLVAGLVILYFKWKWFHDLVDRTAGFLWKHWAITTAALYVLLGPLGLVIGAVGLLIKYWDQVAAAAQKAWNWMKRAGSFLGWATGITPIARAVRWANKKTQGAPVAAAAEGGTIDKSGFVLVGERGPELLHLPQSAQIHPLPAGAHGAGLGEVFTIKVYPQDIYLNGEKIATVVAKAVTDKAARL